MANFCSEQMGSKWLVVKGREKEPKASQTAHKVPKLVLWSTAVSTAVSGWMSNGPDVSGVRTYTREIVAESRPFTKRFDSRVSRQWKSFKAETGSGPCFVANLQGEGTS